MVIKSGQQSSHETLSNQAPIKIAQLRTQYSVLLAQLEEEPAKIEGCNECVVTHEWISAVHFHDDAEKNQVSIELM